MASVSILLKPMHDKLVNSYLTQFNFNINSLKIHIHTINTHGKSHICTHTT